MENEYHVYIVKENEEGFLKGCTEGFNELSLMDSEEYALEFHEHELGDMSKRFDEDKEILKYSFQLVKNRQKEVMKVRIAYEQSLHIANEVAKKLLEEENSNTIEGEKALYEILETNKKLSATIEKILLLESMIN